MEYRCLLYLAEWVQLALQWGIFFFISKIWWIFPTKKSKISEFTLEKQRVAFCGLEKWQKNYCGQKKKKKKKNFKHFVFLIWFWWWKKNFWCINFNMQAWWKKCRQWCEWKDIVFITKTTFELKVFKCIIKWIKPISFKKNY
jgi:hypothetical protein